MPCRYHVRYAEVGLRDFATKGDLRQLESCDREI
jgi:hypothetical protein